MAAKSGRMHTAGIFSDMTVDGPEIGTLVVIMDRAKNLPNRRTMGKQDPYVAARLGKEAKKTETDKRGGQTPRWDQELRFTVHDSVDYHSLKVSVFNDDKKTELIGETWVQLDEILNPGGGQSDSWHSLNCKGKYAGEIRIELTYYDTRPKPEKPVVEKKREPLRAAEGQIQSHSIGGPRESTPPVKRRPLPSDPTVPSPSPNTTPAVQPGISGPQSSGPRSYPRHNAANRAAETTPTQQRRSYHPEQQDRRRPVPEPSPLSTSPAPPTHNPPQTYTAQSSVPAPQYGEDGFDMSYTAPKPYEVQPIEPLSTNHRAMTQDYHSSHPPSHIELIHSHSAPNIPSQLPHEQRQDPYSTQHQEHSGQSHQSPEPYEEPQHQIAPLRLQQTHSRGEEWSFDHHQRSIGYLEFQSQYDPFTVHRRPTSAMQPTVEDEDDMPPPPPVHRRDAATVPPPQLEERPPTYHEDAPAPLNITRYRGEPAYAGYDSPQYGSGEYTDQPSGRRYTHPQQPSAEQSLSRPVSRDMMVSSTLRHKPSIPSSLVPGYDASERTERFRQENQQSLVRANHGDSQYFQASPIYEERQRHHSDLSYQTPPQYETPPRPYALTQHALAQHQAIVPSTEAPGYYPHSSPQEPQQTSPFQDPAPLIKPRAVSPVDTRNAVDNRISTRGPTRSMPTRKSVSPRPPPSRDEPGERRLSGVAFGPDDFNILNPNMQQGSNPGANGDSHTLERRGSNVEVNEKGQVVTFSGRLIDASDHLPVDSWAPEPERKNQPIDRQARERTGLNGARDFRDIRDIEAARQREQDRKDRNRFHNSTTDLSTGSPSSALVTSRHHHATNSIGSHGNNSPAGTSSLALTSRHHYSHSLPRSTDPHALPDYDNSTPPGSAGGTGGRNRLQKRDPRPKSTFGTPTQSPSHIPSPGALVLRDRENLGGYGVGSGGGSPGYEGWGGGQANSKPPIPAKIPLYHDDSVGGGGGGGLSGGEMSALSLELQSIDIGPGPGSGGRNRTAQRRRYGY